jgi:hypothetical protein
MEFLKHLIDDLENTNARLAALEHFFPKTNPLSPTEYRHELELQRRKLQGTLTSFAHSFPLCRDNPAEGKAKTGRHART